MKFDRPATETARWVLSVEDAVWACRAIGPVPISGDAHPGLIPHRRWKWTCQECGATGPMPDDILAPQHDCKSRGPFDEVSRLLIEPVSESNEPPYGWFAFGTYAGYPLRMEFSEALDDGGMPRWERPAPGSN